MEVDQLEVATPNYDGSSIPDFTGFPGQSYNADTNHDGAVDGVNEQTEDVFKAALDAVSGASMSLRDFAHGDIFGSI